MKRDRDDSESPPPKRSRKSDPEPSADEADEADVPERKTDDEKNPYWELSAKRRVIVQDYRKMTFVAIREFYEKDGELKPGKSGINLKVEQFVELVKALPDIIEVLKSKGIDVEAIDKD